MNLKWGIFSPCINEVKLIEAKIQWGLRLFDNVVIVEGHHPNYKDADPNGLSSDGTTEILLSYEDQITYIASGPVENELVLRDVAYKHLKKDLDVVIMSDIDEFYLEKDLEEIDQLYLRNKDLKQTLTNSYIFVDNKMCAPHIQRKESPPIKYSKGVKTHFGQWHERIFRYNKFYSYRRSPFLINDIYGRFLFDAPVYYNERMLLPDIYMLHYKNFKVEEAQKRLQMYDQYDDGHHKHDEEWETLIKNAFEYKGEHPQEIEKIL